SLLLRRRNGRLQKRNSPRGPHGRRRFDKLGRRAFDRPRRFLCVPSRQPLASVSDRSYMPYPKTGHWLRFRHTFVDKEAASKDNHLSQTSPHSRFCLISVPRRHIPHAFTFETLSM